MLPQNVCQLSFLLDLPSNLSPIQVRILHRQIVYIGASSLSNMQQGSKEISFHTSDIRRSLSRKRSCRSETDSKGVRVFKLNLDQGCLTTD